MRPIILAAALCCVPVLSSASTVFYGYVPPYRTCAGDIMDQCCRQVQALVLNHSQWLWECPDTSYLPRGMVEQRYVPVIESEPRRLVPVPPVRKQ